MADAAIAPPAADAATTIDETTRPAESVEAPTVPETKPAVEEDAAPADAPAEEQAPEAAAATDDQAAKDESTDAKPDTTAAESNGANGTPASGKKANNRRKSTGGVPEHKAKKTPSKKKTKELHLDTNPGDMWMVAMRGYQPWPVIICDEQMLPESLLSKRPVSAKRIDGTYRDDFKDDGKNVKDRRFPIMFLGTNEFAWQVNYDLLPFDLEDVKREVESSNPTKKNKNLTEAYVIAAEGHDLAWFKAMLADHEEAMQEDILSKQAKAEEKAKKAVKATKRKSTAGDASDDVDMEDAGDDALSAKKPKATKKRKKDVDSDGEPEKTPKQKLKINNKPKEASAAKPKKEPKAKKSKIDEEETEPAPVEEPVLTESERLARREKSVLYLRHRLQKGFLSRDHAPVPEEMPDMATYIKQLEELENLEAEIIKNTKVHKVLKAIIKLETIPNEEDYNFKTRSNNLLTKWNKALAADAETVEAPAAPAPTTNGVKHDSEKKTEAPAAEAIEEAPAKSESTKTGDADGDVTMAEAKEDAPAVQPDAGSGAEAPVGAAETAVA